MIYEVAFTRAIRYELGCFLEIVLNNINMQISQKYKSLIHIPIPSTQVPQNIINVPQWTSCCFLDLFGSK